MCGASSDAFCAEVTQICVDVLRTLQEADRNDQEVARFMFWCRSGKHRSVAMAVIVREVMAFAGFVDEAGKPYMAAASHGSSQWCIPVIIHGRRRPYMVAASGVSL